MKINSFKSLLRDLSVDYPVIGSVLLAQDGAPARGWSVALACGTRRSVEGETREWLVKNLRKLSSQNLAELSRQKERDAIHALAAEVEAALRVSWIGRLERVREKRNERTVDFYLRDGCEICINVEVYCPQQHTEEREFVKEYLAAQVRRSEGPIRVAAITSHPTTGSGRKWDDERGHIYRDPENRALEFPANKLIDRILSAKRDGAQLPCDEKNVLWLDLKHGLQLSTIDCVPYRSIVAHETCYIGTHGVWHAFYGRKGAQLLTERTVLEWPAPAKTYLQCKNGWFRGMPKASAAVLSVRDGLLLFENPWAANPLDEETRARLVRLSEFRPELSWFGEQMQLEHQVDAMLARITWVAKLLERANF